MMRTFEPVDPRERPTTLSQMLRTAANWLDVADDNGAFERIAASNGMVYDGGRECQTALREVAEWIALSPLFDQLLASKPFEEN